MPAEVKNIKADDHKAAILKILSVQKTEYVIKRCRQGTVSHYKVLQSLNKCKVYLTSIKATISDKYIFVNNEHLNRNMNAMDYHILYFFPSSSRVKASASGGRRFESRPLHQMLPRLFLHGA